MSIFITYTHNDRTFALGGRRDRYAPRPHHLFTEKDYEVVTASNGPDAIDLCREQRFDLVLLDENMPGLSGLETLMQLKDIAPNLPVVMVTKNEEEDIMDQAIGSKIADYLIKPVNPKQILLTLKRIYTNARLCRR